MCTYSRASASRVYNILHCSLGTGLCFKTISARDARLFFLYRVSGVRRVMGKLGGEASPVGRIAAEA